MASSGGVVTLGPGTVDVRSIDFPVLAVGQRKCNHGTILKVVSTSIPRHGVTGSESGAQRKRASQHA